MLFCGMSCEFNFFHSLLLYSLNLASSIILLIEIKIPENLAKYIRARLAFLFNCV